MRLGEANPPPPCLCALAGETNKVVPSKPSDSAISRQVMLSDIVLRAAAVKHSPFHDLLSFDRVSRPKSKFPISAFRNQLEIASDLAGHIAA